MPLKNVGVLDARGFADQHLARVLGELRKKPSG